MRFHPKTLRLFYLAWVVWASAQETPPPPTRVFSHGIIPAKLPDEAPIAPVVDPASSLTPKAVPRLPPPWIRPLPEPPPETKPAASQPTVTEPDLQPVGQEQTREIGARAWRYFEKNYQTSTGWFDSVRGYSFTTMWDLAGGIAAIVCAEKLELLPASRAGEMLGTALRTLAKLNLYNRELPNREYSTVTGAISGPRSSEGKGTGWSALDLGRLLIWLKIVSKWHPEHARVVQDIVKGWKFERLAGQHEMFGTYFSGVRESRRQEGRLGYEQYSAAGFELWGLPMAKAKDYDETQPVRVQGVELAADKRNVPYLTSEPFLLAAFELGRVDPKYTQLTEHVYEAQKRRWEATKIVTAVSEDSLDRLPWFSYFNIYYQGEAWACRNHSGEPAPAACGLSTKAAFGWASLFPGAYSSVLEAAVTPLSSAEGYLAGKYTDGAKNTSLNINTNAVILEAMLFRQRGRHAFLENTQ